MTDKELLLAARAMNDAAYIRHLCFNSLYRSIKGGDYEEALHDAKYLKLDQTHPQIFGAILTRQPKDDN